MLSVTLIIFFSVVLFVYWFRYSCLLILQNRASSVSDAPSTMRFPTVQEQLRTNAHKVEQLDQLQRDLTSDYQKICFLLRCLPEAGVDPLERRMLMLDYGIMRLWYNVSRRLAPPQARGALQEMSNIVSYFASSVSGYAAPRSAS